jgi:hypothetical protein
MTTTIRPAETMTEQWTRSLLKGRRRPAPDFRWQVRGGEDVDLLGPDGLLAALRPGRVPLAVCRHVWGSVRATVRYSERRRADSGLVGFWRAPGAPTGRRDAWTPRHPDEWYAIQVLLRELARVFREELPREYGAQLAATAGRAPAYRIPGTPFTTATVNRNAQFHAHADRGNLDAGLSVMTVLRAGNYAGGHLALPKYLTAFDLRTGDVLIADLRKEVHVNTPLAAGRGPGERLSVIAYVRADLLGCPRSV